MKVFIFLFLCLSAWGQGSLSSDCLFDFAEGAKAKDLIGQRDAYVKIQEQLERAQRLGSDEGASVDDYLRQAQKSVRDFSKEEKDLLNQASSELAKSFALYNLPLPSKIYYIKTNGSEEGAPYTRENFIVFPEFSLKKNLADMKELLAHEIFHIMSRYNKKLSTELYKIIGFRYCGKIEEPPPLRRRRITNPDAPIYEHFIKLRNNKGEIFPAIPFLYLRIHSLDEVDQQSVFRHMKLGFLKIDLHTKKASGPIIPVKDIAPSLFKQIGKNTNYIIHPEETISDNFAQIMCGIEPKTKRIHDEMREVLKKDRASR